MSVLRLVTQIVPESYDRGIAPPLVQGHALFNESSGDWPQLQAETTIFKCEESADWRPEGLIELRKSRLRLSASEAPPPPLVRVRPAPGGVLVSVPLRITREDLQSEKGSKRFKCNVCGKTYNSRKPFITHCRLHERSKNMVKPKAMLLPMAFDDFQPKKVSKRFKCNVCGKRYTSKLPFTKHCRIHQRSQITIKPDPPPPKNFKCDLCGRDFRSAALFSVHCEQHRLKREEVSPTQLSCEVTNSENVSLSNIE